MDAIRALSVVEVPVRDYSRSSGSRAVPAVRSLRPGRTCSVVNGADGNTSRVSVLGPPPRRTSITAATLQARCRPPCRVPPTPSARAVRSGRSRP